MAIDAFLCDIGNVAVFFDNARSVRAFADISHKNEDAVREIIFRKGVGAIRRFESGDMDSEEFLRITCGRLNVTKHETPTPFVLFNAWTDVFRPNAPLLERVRVLMTQGVVTAAVSNIDPMRHRKLEQLYLLSYFDHLLMSYAEKMRKPSEELMVRALDRCGATAERTVFIDDLEENLVPAAKLGIATHLYTDIDSLDRFLEARLA